MLRALVCAALLAAAAEANAEIFRCRGPNGEVRFTSDATQCPSAVPHTVKDDAVQRASSTPAPLATARPGGSTGARRPAARGSEPSAAAESMWRRRKSEAELKVRELEAEDAHLAEATKWCNKGHGVVRENPRTGMRESVRCADIAAARERVTRELAVAREYRDGGLEEECRRSGCLPGWLRD
jgi:hypothetical protein